MPFTKKASYIVKGRSSYHLQRLVPMDCRKQLGRSKWTAPGGTFNQARARVPAFLARTDREIRAARGEQLSPEERLLQHGLQGEDIQESLELVGVPTHIKVAADEYIENPELDRYIDLAKKVEKEGARELLTTERLLQARYHERQPASRTYEGWRKALNAFMAHNGKARPGLCTKADAVGYVDYLLTIMSRNSAKTQVAYCSGLWTTLCDREKAAEHIWKGQAAKLNPTTKEQALLAAKAKRNQSFEPATPVEEWSGSIYVDVFRLLYYSGCRLAEVAGLSGEDLHEDYISVQWSDERGLKTAHSVRDIPLHPNLRDTIAPLIGRSGPIWPRLKTVSEVDGIEVIRWGGNLSKPCKLITGLRPKDFRDRFVTQLREKDFNQINIERLTGHSAITTNSTYGGRNWDNYVRMVNTIQ